MMTRLGHEVIHYGHELSEVECTEHVSVTTEKMFLEGYGRVFPDFTEHHFIDRVPEVHPHYHNNVVEQVVDRGRETDFLLCFWGVGHREIAEEITQKVDMFVVEPGVGYSHTFARHRVFESNAWMHFCYGIDVDRKSSSAFSPPWHDITIPCCFDMDEFDFCSEKEDYHLFLGRVVDLKGWRVAVQATEKAGKRLIIVGQHGNSTLEELGFEDGLPEHVELRGAVNIEERKGILAKAAALWCPTYYAEPFGKVVIEALLSGTPVITSDWGAFSETNLHGITGYRCRNFEEFVWAAENINKISPFDCRRWAQNNFSMERLAPVHESYYKNLLRLKTTSKGWYSLEPRHSFDEREKYYPSFQPSTHLHQASEFTALENSMLGEDIYLVASGGSLDYIEPSFFDNKRVVCVNQSYRFLKNYDFIVVKNPIWYEFEDFDPSKVIYAKHREGRAPLGDNNFSLGIKFEHPQHGWSFEQDPFDFDFSNSEQLYVSKSTFTTALHFCAFLGAKNIIVVGHDCGLLDNQLHFKKNGGRGLQNNMEEYCKWGSDLESTAIKLRDCLRGHYGVNIYSINPFISMNLEGHKFASFGGVST